jgi:Protein of unknown function (DUF2637)
VSPHTLGIVRGALVWAASALVFAVAVLAFVVSFEAISSFAVQVGAFPHGLRYCAPLLVDSFTAAATLVILWLSLTSQPIATAWYAWALVGAATCVSVAINVAHAPDWLAARLVAALPPVALLLAVELLMILARRTLARTGAPQPHTSALDPHPNAPEPQPGASDPHPGARAALNGRSGAPDVRAAVAELVAQERAGARPRLTGRQVAELVGVKERRAQVLLREFRTTNDQAAGNGHRQAKGGTDGQAAERGGSR